MAKTPKLHEVIAVKSGLRTQALKTMGDLSNTFEKKQHHFTAKIRTFTPKDETEPAKTEEELKLQTTVKKELQWVSTYIQKAIDASNHAATGDTKAFADVVLEDGTVIAEHVPGIMLLELEDRLEEIRKFADKIPTLDPAKGFKPDSDQGDGVYVAREVEKQRTMKQKKVYVLYPHSDKHPAQTALVDEDVPVGTIREQEWSSMVTPSEKGDILDRIEKLARAVKRARTRANDLEIETPTSIGDPILKYIFGV